VYGNWLARNFLRAQLTANNPQAFPFAAQRFIT
jgi:hypothetical protein